MKCTEEAGHQSRVTRFHRQWAAVTIWRSEIRTPVQYCRPATLMRPTVLQGYSIASTRRRGLACESAVGRSTRAAKRIFASIFITAIEDRPHREDNPCMNEPRYQSFGDFYPFYLREHTNRLCRRLHFIGSTLVLIVLLKLVATGN